MLVTLTSIFMLPHHRINCPNNLSEASDNRALADFGGKGGKTAPIWPNCRFRLAQGHDSIRGSIFLVSTTPVRKCEFFFFF